MSRHGYGSSDTDTDTACVADVHTAQCYFFSSDIFFLLSCTANHLDFLASYFLIFVESQSYWGLLFRISENTIFCLCEFYLHTCVY